MLRPPGYKRPAPKRKAAEEGEEGEEEVSAGAAGAAAEAAEAAAAKAAAKKRRTSAEVAAASLPAERTVKVRDSTRQRVQEAEEERKVLEAVSRPDLQRTCAHELPPACPLPSR